jgi:hypothetical protein
MSQGKRSQCETFPVTSLRPYIPIPDRLDRNRAELVGDGVVTLREFTDLELTGQEFLVFRGIRERADVGNLVPTWGDLGLQSAVMSISTEYFWANILSRPATDYWRRDEPVEDWIRQAGLLDVACGLLGLQRSSAARRALQTAVASLELVTYEEALAATRHWAARAVLDGARRAGLVASRRPGRSGIGFHAPSDPSGLEPYGIPFVPLEGVWKPKAVAWDMWSLLLPWLHAVRLGAVQSASGLAPGLDLPFDDTLLAYLWLQVANAAFSQTKPKQCAWRRCPGPPDRLGVFLWQWGKSPTGVKHGDALYCDPRCAHAAAVATSRERKKEYEAARKAQG